MDEEIFGYLAKEGPPFFGPTLMTTGSFMLLLGMFFSLIMILSTRWGNYQGSPFVAFLMMILFFLGSFLFFIGFIAFCSRWGATGKRRAELIEITSALSAIQAAKNNKTSSL